MGSGRHGEQTGLALDHAEQAVPKPAAPVDVGLATNRSSSSRGSLAAARKASRCTALDGIEISAGLEVLRKRYEALLDHKPNGSPLPTNNGLAAASALPQTGIWNQRVQAGGSPGGVLGRCPALRDGRGIA